MVERKERIPADEIAEPKLWNLPYWTEPASVIKAREKAEAEPVVVEEDEIEVEPLTIEQLEHIRQEAYNEGLQQGLVEGRQKGEKLGFDAGNAEGLVKGQEEGRKLGFEAGQDEGKKQALDESKLQTDETVEQLKSAIAKMEDQLNQQKSAMEELLPDLVTMLAKAVVGEELDQGSEHIVALVNTALAALPLQQHQLNIEINPLDLPYLEAAFMGSEFESCLSKSDKIEAGGCVISSEYSLVNFSQSDRWQSVLKEYNSQLQLGLLQPEQEQEQKPEAELKVEAESDSELNTKQTQDPSPDPTQGSEDE